MKWLKLPGIGDIDFCACAIPQEKARLYLKANLIPIF
jgi:hypothetical protein